MPAPSPRAPPPARILLWVMSAGALALVARSLLLEPVPMSVAVAALVAYAAVTALGWVLPTLQMYGDIVQRLPVDAQQRGAEGYPAAVPAIALTFDDGPDPCTTSRVLDALRDTEHRATFFVIGEKATLHPELVERMVNEGHCVALHGYRHRWLYAFQTPRRIAQDVRRCQAAVAGACPTAPILFRPPLGHVSPRVTEGARRAGVTIVGFSARGYDGLRRTTPSAAWRRLRPRLIEGAIVLLHDAAERGSHTPASLAILGDLLRELDARGLRSRPLDRLL